MRRIFCGSVFLLISILPVLARNIATAPMAMYVANDGNDSNNGLTWATRKQHYCAGIYELSNNWDFQGNQPFLFAASNQQFNEMCSSGGPLVGAVSIIVAPYDPANPSSPGNIVPSPNFVRSCTLTSPVGPCGSSTPVKQWCDSFGDFGIRIYYNITWTGCNVWNMVGGGAVVTHNPAVIDFFGTGSIFSGSGNNDVALLADGQTTISVAGGATFQGQFEKAYRCNRDCLATISGPISLVSSNVNGIYGMYGGAKLYLGATYSVSGSIVGPSIVSGASWITTNGTTVPGTIVQQFGGQICLGGPNQC